MVVVMATVILCLILTRGPPINAYGRQICIMLSIITLTGLCAQYYANKLDIFTVLGPANMAAMQNAHEVNIISLFTGANHSSEH